MKGVRYASTASVFLPAQYDVVVLPKPNVQGIILLGRIDNMGPLGDVGRLDDDRLILEYSSNKEPNLMTVGFANRSGEVKPPERGRTHVDPRFAEYGVVITHRDGDRVIVDFNGRAYIRFPYKSTFSTQRGDGFVQTEELLVFISKIYLMDNTQLFIDIETSRQSFTDRDERKTHPQKEHFLCDLYNRMYYTKDFVDEITPIEGKSFWFRKYNKHEIYAVTGAKVFEKKDANLTLRTDGKFLIKENSVVGLLNSEGKEIIPPQYDEIENFNEGFAVAEGNGGKRLVNNLGTEVIPPKNYNVMYEYSNGRVVVAEKDRSGFHFGVLDSRGKEIVPITKNKYAFIHPFREGLAPFVLYGTAEIENRSAIGLNLTTAKVPVKFMDTNGRTVIDLGKEKIKMDIMQKKTSRLPKGILKDLVVPLEEVKVPIQSFGEVMNPAYIKSLASQNLYYFFPNGMMWIQLQLKTPDGNLPYNLWCLVDKQLRAHSIIPVNNENIKIVSNGGKTGAMVGFEIGYEKDGKRYYYSILNNLGDPADSLTLLSIGFSPERVKEVRDATAEWLDNKHKEFEDVLKRSKYIISQDNATKTISPQEKKLKVAKMWSKLRPGCQIGLPGLDGGVFSITYTYTVVKVQGDVVYVEIKKSEDKQEKNYDVKTGLLRFRKEQVTDITCE